MLGDYPAAATIATADLARARTFYEETLGLKVEMEDDPGGILYATGGSTVLLYQSQFAGPSKVTVATWMVDDLDRVVDELSAKGITFEQYDFRGLKTDAQRCLQFVRSTPGVTAPLCGMKDVAHVEENSAVCAAPPFTVEEFNALIGRA